MDDFLKRYRTRLKLAATQQLEETIKKVFQIIKDDSNHKNTAIIIQARYQNLEQDSMRNIIAEPDRILRTNQITNNLFDLIDNLEVTDLQQSDDLLLNRYLTDLEKNNSEQNTATDQMTDDSQEDDSSDETVSFTTKARSIESAAEDEDISPKSSRDLEYFSELHRKDLSFFPVIYRELRSRVFKGEGANPELGQMVHDLEKKLPEFQKFRTIINQLEPILKRIRVDHDKRAFWVKFQELSNRRTSLTFENMASIEKINQELSAFVTLLEGHGIIKKGN